MQCYHAKRNFIDRWTYSVVIKVTNVLVKFPGEGNAPL